MKFDVKSLKIAVLGAGSFGTAVAQSISKNVENVILFSRRKEIADNIKKIGYNLEYYPNTELSKNIIPTTDLNDIKGSNVVFVCVPSAAFRKTIEEIKKIGLKDSVIVATAKGIEYPSLKTMGSIIEEYFDDNYVVMSGPNFASEIILNLATVSNIASNNQQSLKIVKNVLETDEFKVEVVDDVIGLELCGVMKNINAIAYGICEGMNINENAKYAILTKGFNETKKIITAVGGKSSTVNQYCGFGDLVLTSTSKESRNHTLGMLYGQKIIVDEKSSGILFEGKNSIKTIKDICDQNSIDSSIVNFVYNVIIDEKPPKLSFKDSWNNICE